MRIIAAIDIIDGQCVRLTQGDFGRKTLYRADPVDLARKMEDNGIRYLHLVDLDGARRGEYSAPEFVGYPNGSGGVEHEHHHEHGEGGCCGKH